MLVVYFWFEHDLRANASGVCREEKPVPTFPDHALGLRKGRNSMEEIAAGRAAEALLAEHKARLRFRTLGPPQAPATISDAYDIQDRYVALLRGEHGAA